MLTCCTSFSFNKDITSGRRSLDDFLKICQELGIQGVEFWDEHIEKYIKQGRTLKELKENVKSRGLNLVTIAVNNHDFTSLDTKARKKDIENVLEWIENVDTLGCKILRVLPGNLIALNKDEKNLYPLSVSSFEECLKEAKRRNITLAIENCPKGTDPAVVRKIVKEFNSPYLKTCPDIGNIRIDIRYSSFELLLPFAVHVHAKTYQFAKNGEETTIDYNKVMKMLKDNDYRGYITIEFEGESDEFTGVKKSLDLIKNYL